MATLQVTEEQLLVLQRALEFYNRVGIGQMEAIINHPTFEEVLYDKLRPVRELQTGDRTQYGEVMDITSTHVQTKGSWYGTEDLKWYRKELVKLSIDYAQFHSIRKEGLKLLNQARNVLLQEDIHPNGSYGIHNPNVHQSCRVAYDIVKVIRHEFWKRDPDRSSVTVDSSVHLTTKDSDKIKVTL